MQQHRIPLGLRSRCSDKICKNKDQSISQLLPLGAFNGCCHMYNELNSALRYLAMNKEAIKVAILDSPFASLKRLFLEIGKQRTNFPEIVLNMVFKYLKPIIISKADFNID